MLSDPCACGLAHGDPTRRAIIACYDYTDAAGQLIYQAVRYEPKNFALRRPDGVGGWIWKMDGVTRLPYRLPELLATSPEEPVFIPEGEKHVDRLIALGLVATTNSEGAGKWRGELNQYVANRPVVLLPDNDEPGRRHVERVASDLSDIAASVKVVALPDLPPKGDVIDWLDEGHTAVELLDLADAAPLWHGATAQPAGESRRAASGGKGNQSTLLVELLADAELFHDSDQTPYATIDVDGHYETYQVGSTALKRLLSHRFYERYGKAPASQQLHDAFNTLSGRATSSSSTEQAVHVRVAEADDAIYLDLCDRSWQVVRVSATGWEVITNPPVKFRRPTGARPLPVPERNGDLRDLRRFVNFSDDGQFALLVAYLLSGLRLGIQYPVLVLNGVQGAAKSTLARIVKELIDPCSSPLNSVPRDTGDLLVSAKHTWFLAIDNVSWLQDWLSDALCRLSTGGGITKRKLYTDDEPVTIDVQRPVILTGIGEIVTRGDLLDRSFVLHLPAIEDDQRRDEKEFAAEFFLARPKILGALLDIVVVGLANLPKTRIKSAPRLAAAATWIVACEPALPWAPGAFLEAYRTNRRAANAIVLESSPIYAPLVKIVAAGPWAGTFSELLHLLQASAEEGTTHRKGWPTVPAHLSNALQRIEPSLRQEGWTIERPGRRIRIVAPPNLKVQQRTDVDPATESAF
ncbi:MAG: hypothetical protein M3T56_05890 [Chloroflexota bacterium]|nr:hypothetical protein [Chloroflexota bacterium]